MDTSESQLTTNMDSTIKDDESGLLTTTQSSNGQTLTSNFISNITELESTNVSSVSLTDATTTGLSSFSESYIDKSRNATRDLLYKKQMLHDIQKLKIELSQKNLMIDTLKAEHLNQLDDLEEKLADAIHGKQMFQAKYETESRVFKTEMDKQVSLLKKELQESGKMQKYYQKKYDDEMKNKDELVDFRTGYIPKDLNEDDYLELKSSQENELSIQDVFDIKLYEATRPLKIQIDSLLQRLELLTGDFHDKEQELEAEKQDLEEARRARAELDVRCQRFQVQLEELRGQANQKTYKNQNFDLVQSERDALERQIVDLERSCTVYKTELEGKTEQMEMIRNQMLEQNQTVALLKQDKEYLSKQLNEATPRLKLVEEKLQQTAQQLDDAKQAREDLYEKYLNSREHYKREYEERMRQEVDELSSKTNNELDRIKESMKEMYERENRSLVDSKNTAILEQERLNNSEKTIQAKYNELLGEFRQVQLSSDSRVSDTHNEMKMKSFELDRMQLLYEESLKTNKSLAHQNDTLALKMETLSKEYYELKNTSQQSVMDLSTKNEELHTKLTIYEKLERELDDVVMQAAELTNEDDSERVLFAYGYGANVPSTAKRRMQQSVQLARRVSHLERTNTSLRHEAEKEVKQRKQLSEELQNATNLLDEAQQPYNYLIDSIRSRDEQNKSLKKTVTVLEDDLRQTRRENSSLKISNNEIGADLERLLNQRAEISVLKQVVLGLRSSQDHDSFLRSSHNKSIQRQPKTTLLTSNNAPKQTTNNVEYDEPTVGKPIVFENSEAPTWYTRLKNKNQQSVRSRTQNQ